jgi:hypothetical protein
MMQLFLVFLALEVAIGALGYGLWRLGAAR